MSCIAGVSGRPSASHAQPIASLNSVLLADTIYIRFVEALKWQHLASSIGLFRIASHDVGYSCSHFPLVGLVPKNCVDIRFVDVARVPLPDSASKKI